ncbi:hypothetical protein H0H87_001983 [Tephrocybe sp. NHM501043]|nr:hypothetical protein H0H87_001983 [Tephrocybe sp. NHM501043]
MSIPPPSRIRSKTSDFTQFFRGPPSRHSSQHDPVASPAANLAVPDAPESSTPKKSKLPFLGRTRKKSTQSAKSGTGPPTARGYESEVTELPSSRKDRRLSQPVPSPEPTIRHPPLPATSGIPQINVTSPSLSSKFVAHFSNSKLRKPARASGVAPDDGNTTDTLSPPTDARTTSFDSTITTTATIPPPRGAVIAITSSHNKIEEYKSLFTLPHSRKPIAPRRQATTPASEYRDRYHKTESSITLTPPSPSSPRAEHSISPPHDNRPLSSSRHETKERDTRRLADGGKPLKTATKKRAQQGPKLAEDSTPEDSVDESVRPVDLAPAIDVTPPPPSAKPSSPPPRLRKRASSAIKEARASTPPSIPLPAPPTDDGSPSSPTFPRSSPKLPTAPPPSALSLRRPRANTIGSVPLTPQANATVTAQPLSPTRGSPKLSGEKSYAFKQSPELETSDLDALSIKQLKEALMQRNQQYTELATHLLEVTKNHVAEKAAFEKKIAALDAEVARKDKEIQGFTWMLNNRNEQLSTDNEIDYTRIPGPRIQRSPSAASSKMSSRRIHQTDDSGAESPSGAESVRGSGASVSSASMSSRLKKGLRPLTLGESSYSIYQSSIMSKSSSNRGPAVDNGHSEPRSSLYSLSSTPSATSSNSSLLPPSPTILMSSLSAIPEVSAVPPSRVPLPRILTSPTPHSLSASSDWDTDGEKKHHDVVRASRRISSSSLSSSSSSAATSAYSANLKRGRPPSIAQVMQKSPMMDDVLGKLRPFAAAAPAAAYT